MEPLLSDREILERSKLWSNVMATFCEEEKFEEIAFDEITTPCESEEISDDQSPNRTINNNNNEKENTCMALVKVDNFEGETSSDDFDECANQTVAIMKDHTKKWEKFGMVDVLETFDLDKISKVVTPWIEKHKLDQTQLSTSLDEQIVHIEEHHHHRRIHEASDDDSLHSLDTANYIRSSRKNKRSSCTTTTIKKFSFVKGSRRHLQKKFGLGGFDLSKDIDMALYDKFPKETVAQRGLEKMLGQERSCCSNLTPPSQLKAIAYEPRSVPVRRRRSRPLKRRSDVPKRFVSSSSSSSRSPMPPVKPTFRKSSKINSVDVNMSEVGSQTTPKKTISLAKHHQLSAKKLIDLTMLETSDSEPQKPSKKIVSVPKLQLERPKAIPGPTIQSGSSCNETGFLGASIINSTALSNTNTNLPSLPSPMKKCVITPIKNTPDQVNPLEKINKLPELAPEKPIPSKPPPPPPVIPVMKPIKVTLPRLKTKKIEKTEKTIEKNVPQEDNSKILLYCPTNLEAHKQHVSCKHFNLTREYFLESVGEKNSRRFIKRYSKKFPFEFDCTSRIYFKLPDESVESASSDEDVLSMFGHEGKIIVETVEQRNGQCA